MRKNDLKILLILGVIFLCLILIYTGFGNIYGSMTDWVMQHTVIPDYLRTLFYKTGNLFPNLAMNAGAGENAYYLSYYGLLNPFILISYLLPFVKMIDYLIVINIIVVIISAFLIYKWLSNNKFDSKIAFTTSLLFMLINAFFHAHRHIMFIDYMPFLILGLIGIDIYFKHKKSYLYIISVFLMIMTSYYFSVGGLLCLVIYGIYKYIKINKKITVKSFLIDGLKFLIPMFIGVMMSFILLIPTVLAITSSRSQIKDVIDISSILIPNFNFDSLLYSNYSMGFTSVAVIALIYLLMHSKREKRFLSIIMFIIITFPIFMYVLNGMLYLRSKVFIPLSPLIVLLISIFLTEVENKRVLKTNFMEAILIIVMLSLIFDYDNTYFLFDLLLTTVGLVVTLAKNNKTLHIVLIIIALVSNITVNRNDTYVSNGTYKYLTDNKISSLIESINKKDKTFYRMDNIIGDTSLTVNKIYSANYYQTSIYSSTYNSNYKNFYDNVINNAIPYRNNLLRASTSNIMFETLMGIKYIIADDKNVPIGYQKLSNNDYLNIYKNDYIFSLGYSSNSLMSMKDLAKLDYPYRSEALLNNIVVDKNVTSNYTSLLQKIDLSYTYVPNLDAAPNNEEYTVDSNKEEKITLKLDEPIVNKVLFIKFRIDKAAKCSEGDISITINGVTNKLTCREWLYFNNNYDFEYAISSPNKISKLDIEFSKGNFKLENIKTYTLDYDTIKQAVLKIDKFIVDTNKTKGNIIDGKINVTNDGYFATTIPYDKGYSIYLDNKRIDYEKVNTAFIGFPITKGGHNIRIIYASPGYIAGLISSIIGLLLFTLVIIKEKRLKS
jgi:uncharacterized membrane protein YfhO